MGGSKMVKLTVRRGAVVLAAALLWAAIAAASASAAPVTLATGQMLAPDGVPLQGQVIAYAWSPKDHSRSLSISAQATTDAAGSYVLIANDGARLQRLARRTDGWLDFYVSGGDGSHGGALWFNRRITGAAAASASAQDPNAPLALQPLVTTARARASGPDPPLCTHGSTFGRPKKERLGTLTRRTPIGEINNAYSDTVGTFTYTRGAESQISVAIQLSKGPFQLRGNRTVVNTKVREKTIARRGHYAKIVQTKMIYARNRVIECGIRGTEIRTIVVATGHSGGIYEEEQPGTLNVCPCTWSYPGGTGITRAESTARTFGGGVTAWGVNLDATTGFSNQASLKFEFGGGERDRHYACGEAGKSPEESQRVFTGLKRS